MVKARCEVDFDRWSGANEYLYQKAKHAMNIDLNLKAAQCPPTR
jgi:hypothetical protein